MKRLFILMLFLTAAGLSGAQPKITGEEEAKAYSQQLCRVFFEGKYTAFTALLPEAMLPKFSQVLYRVSLDELHRNGPCQLPMQYLATLRRPGMLLLLWKVEYRSNGGELLDRLASTSFSIENGCWTLTGFRFI